MHCTRTTISKEGNKAHRSAVAAPLLLAAAALLAAPSAVTAGDIKGPPGSPIWVGGVNNLWNIAGNWTTGSVPADDEAAIIMDGPFNTVFLNGDSANLQSLFIGNAKTVATNGWVMQVMNSPATTNVQGLDSRLHVTPVGGGGYGFRTQELTIGNEGHLHMAGGHVRVHDQLELLSGGRVSGHGRIEIASAHPAAFDGLDGGTLHVAGNLMRLQVTGGGGMRLPEFTTIAPDGTLWLNGPVFSSVQNVELGANSVLDVDGSWTLAGELNVDTGADEVAYVDGGGWLTSEGSINVANSGQLSINSNVTFPSGSETTVVNLGTLELNGTHASQAGHFTTLGVNSTLRINGSQPLALWMGDISSLAGIIETNNVLGYWRHGGELTLGSVGGIRPQLNGTSDFRASGQVNIEGTGAIINNRFDLRPDATMTIEPTAELQVSGELLLETNSITEGDGTIVINDGAEFTAAIAAQIHPDVVNNGTFATGTTEQPSYTYMHGSYTQGPSGRLMVDVGTDSPTALERDVYETSHGVELAGELFINLTFDYVPTVGDTFEIFWANGGITGEFDTIAGEPGFSVVYDGNTILIVYDGVANCPADLNDDGSVNVSDLLALLSAWGPCDGDCDADLDGNGSVNVSDLLELLSAWGSCV